MRTSTPKVGTFLFEVQVASYQRRNFFGEKTKDQQNSTMPQMFIALKTNVQSQVMYSVGWIVITYLFSLPWLG